MRYVDLTNERRGKVVALYYTGRVTPDRVRIWACRCDCGTELEMSTRKFCPSRTKKGYEVACPECVHKKRVSVLKANTQRVRARVHPDVHEHFGDLTYEQVDNMLGLANGTTNKRVMRGWPAKACLELRARESLRDWRERNGQP